MDRQSGWTELAAVYWQRESFRGKRWWLQGGRMRGQMSTGPMTVGANGLGLYLKILPLFAPRGPALFIPWSDITVRTGREWVFWQYYEFRFERVPDVPLRINPWLARRLARAAGRSWPGDSADAQ
jgi:hypothetical protein